MHYLSVSEIAFCKLSVKSSYPSSFRAITPRQQDIFPNPYSWHCSSPVPWEPHTMAQSTSQHKILKSKLCMFKLESPSKDFRLQKDKMAI